MAQKGRKAPASAVPWLSPEWEAVVEGGEVA